MAQWRQMEIQKLVNIDLGNGFLPDSTKPLPEPVLVDLIISEVLLHSPEDNFTGNAQDI